MAMGKPVIVADRGMLPELVNHEVSGLVVKDTSEGLAQAVLRLLHHPELRGCFGKAAHQKAHQDFKLDRQVEAVEQFYQEMMRLGKWTKRSK
jgi:glycosyltransferase involved in cell wall biosynthesis